MANRITYGKVDLEQYITESLAAIGTKLGVTIPVRTEGWFALRKTLEDAQKQIAAATGTQVLFDTSSPTALAASVAMVFPIVLSGSGGSGPVLGTLSLSAALVAGTASSGNIIGATAGSLIVSNVPGLTINSAARTYSYNGSTAGSTANGLVETLGGASKNTGITVTGFVTNPSSPSGDRTVSLTSRVALPDGAYPASAGSGFPSTGLDLASDGTFWAGQGTAGNTATAGLLRLSSDLTTALSQITVGSMSLPSGSVQGVAIDDSDGSLYFILVDVSGSTYIAHCTTSGILISSTAIGSTLNGIAYDNQRDCLIVLYDSGNVRWQSKAAPHAVLSGVPAFIAAGTDNDQMFYDPTRKELLISGGANGVNGTVDIYNVASTGATLLGTYTLDQCLAIEGVVRRDNDIIVLSDQKTHPAGSNTFNYNQADIYVNAFVPGVPSFTVSNASANEGAAAGFVVTANRNGVAGNLSGTWTTLVGGSYGASAADFPGGTAPSGTWMILDGSNTVTVNVTSYDDTDQEANETYGFQVSYNSSVVATGSGTINDNDAPAGSYSTEANALFARMSTQPDTTRKSKINDLIVSLKNAGVWAKADSLGAEAAHTQQAGLLNWAGTKADPTLVGGCAFTTDKGLTTDGSSGYIDYGFTPSAGTNYLQNSATIALWLNNNSAMTNGSACMSTMAANLLALNPRAASNASAYRVNCTTANTGNTSTDSRGLSAASRTASNVQQLYKNGAASGSAGTSASSAPSTANFVSGATASPAVFQLQSFAFWFIGAGLTATENQALYDAVNTYMTAIGNQVV